eukprot:s676_g4.t1
MQCLAMQCNAMCCVVACCVVACCVGLWCASPGLSRPVMQCHVMCVCAFLCCLFVSLFVKFSFCKEGVPEKAETEDYFATVTLFKQHHFAVPLSAEARSALRFWMDRSRRGQYFLFYDNGKSVCRTDCRANAKNQHIWQLPPGSTSCTALADPRHMDVDGFVDCPDPCILHFPVCGLSWLNGKYRTLGKFPDKWLGKVNLSESFHKDARDLAESCSALEDLFMREVLLEDEVEVRRQLEAQTCMRILDHAQLLDSEAKAWATETKKEKTILPLADTSLMGIEKGTVSSQLALLVPTFDPSTDNVEIWSSKVELLLAAWPPRLILGCKGTAYQKLQLHQKELLKNEADSVKRFVVGGTCGAIPLEKKFELVEKALY